MVSFTLKQVTHVQVDAADLASEQTYSQPVPRNLWDKEGGLEHRWEKRDSWTIWIYLCGVSNALY